MTVKKECFVKSLKSDYSSLGLVTMVGAIIIGIVVICTIYRDQFYILTQYLTAFNIYVVLASIFSLITPVALALDDYSSSPSRKGVNDKETIWVVLLLNFFLVFIPWFTYILMQPYSNYPDITIQTLMILTINTFIATPLLLAYARCKE